MAQARKSPTAFSRKSSGCHEPPHPQTSRLCRMANPLHRSPEVPDIHCFAMLERQARRQRPPELDHGLHGAPQGLAPDQGLGEAMNPAPTSTAPTPAWLSDLPQAVAAWISGMPSIHGAPHSAGGSCARIGSEIAEVCSACPWAISPGSIGAHDRHPGRSAIESGHGPTKQAYPPAMGADRRATTSRRHAREHRKGLPGRHAPDDRAAWQEKD